MRWLPFNQKSTKTQIGVLVLIVLFLTALCTRCATAGEGEPYTQIGGGSTIVRGAAPVIDVSFVYPKAAPGDAVLEVGATFVGGSTFKGAYQQNNFVWRAAIVDALGPVEIGLGAVYLQNTDTYNGSHTNFTLILGYRFARWPLTLRLDQHISNGGTTSVNKGRDMSLFIYRAK